jgi:amino acid transporter
MLLTAIVLALHGYHAYAEDLDGPPPLWKAVTGLLLAMLADSMLPQWLLVTIMMPYFIVVLFGIGAWSATVTRGLAVRRSHTTEDEEEEEQHQQQH